MSASGRPRPASSARARHRTVMLNWMFAALTSPPTQRPRTSASRRAAISRWRASGTPASRMARSHSRHARTREMPRSARRVAPATFRKPRASAAATQARRVRSAMGCPLRFAVGIGRTRRHGAELRRASFRAGRTGVLDGLDEVETPERARGKARDGGGRGRSELRRQIGRQGRNGRFVGHARGATTRRDGADVEMVAIPRLSGQGARKCLRGGTARNPNGRCESRCADGSRLHCVDACGAHDLVTHSDGPSGRTGGRECTDTPIARKALARRTNPSI